MACNYIPGFGFCNYGVRLRSVWVTCAAMADITSYWCKHEKLWQVRFPWLMARWTGDTVTGIGCSICSADLHRAGPTSGAAANVWATCSIAESSMQPSAFANHARSKLHRAAAGEFVDEVGLSPVEAPPVSDFAAVLQAVWSGKGATANAGEWKFRKMLWALAEANRDRLRESLEMASTISVNQDARAGRLVIGFSCADGENLQAATGYFSQVNLYEEGFEADSKGVYMATVYAVHKLCTRRLGSPCEFREGASSPELMHELLEHIRQRTE